MTPEYIQKLLDISIKVSDPNKSSNEHQLLICAICDNKWTATPKSKIQNYKKYKSKGCPICTFNNTYNSTRIENINTIKEKFEIMSQFDIKEFCNNLMLTVKNKKCGHIFTSKTGNLLNRNVTCPTCNTEVKRANYIKFNEQRHTAALLTKNGYDKYTLLVNKLTRDTYKKFGNIINPNNLPRARSGQDGYHLDHIISKKYCFQNNIPAETCAHKDNLRMVYWKDNAQKWMKPHIFFPQIFCKYVKSFDKINNFISSVSTITNVKSLDSSLLPDQTLTIVCESEKTVIQFLALNENLESNIGSKHFNKKLQNNVEKLGYRFVAIFEDEWDKSPQLVLNKLTHILNKTQVNGIMARKCQIRNITNAEKNNFLKANHIQGTSVSQINLGAFYNNELVAVMTFCKPRILMNKKIDKNIDSWELSRFATNMKYRVIGIASKLLSHFKKTHSWDNIYSFADRRWSYGNLYDKLGFKLSASNPPEYYYVINNKRMHRWGFRKDAIREKFPQHYDPRLTEYENMRKLGIDRVWDCGMLKYIMSK